MRTFGTRDRFEMAFELRPDPDPGGIPHERASWGAYEIWIEGRNLTSGRCEDGELLERAEVPLAPILEWLVTNWDALLHEERLPMQSNATSAAAWRITSLAALPEEEEAFDHLLEVRERYWHRHGMGSSLPGFRIPDLHIRRLDQDAELSWDDREWRSVPRGVRLIDARGRARLPAEEVACVLHDWANALIEELAYHPDATEFCATMRDELREIRERPRVLERLQLAAGLDLEAAEKELASRNGKGLAREELRLQVLLGLEPNQHQPAALVTKLTVPALLYRSARPDLAATDVVDLLFLTRALPPAPTDEPLRAVQHPALPPSSPIEITQDGYERARELREKLGIELDLALTGAWDLERVVVPRLGLRVREVALADPQIDGAAAIVPGRSPLLAVNTSGRFAQSAWGRRMTLAHELCHLLHDFDADGALGIVSNPWAPSAVERRANAFAAMLLCPPEALRRLLPGVAATWTREHLLHAMRELGVGKSTLTWNLYNFEWISDSERMAWLDEL